MNTHGNDWSPDFRDELERLLLWRRDVRHFKTDPVPEELLDDCLRLADRAPSVGFSQPWRFVKVRSACRRQAITDNFEACNRAALDTYSGEKRDNYARLKLAGLQQAPVHLAVLCNEADPAGHGLGRGTMQEMLRYSVVCAIHTLWLAARSVGLGVGWVSILDPVKALETIDAPHGHFLIAYLCIGWPSEEHHIPELERSGWESRQSMDGKVLIV